MTSNQKLDLIRVNVCVLIILIGFLLFLGIQQFDFQDELNAQPPSESGTNDKVVILNFDDGRKSQYTNAKPILDKYGFKATFYVVCTYIGAKEGYMNWQDIETLHREGHDIASHGMHHIHLDKLPTKDIDFELSESKKCLQDHSINAKSFAYPFGSGSDNKTVINTVAKYYGIARAGNDALAFLRCNNPGIQPTQTDCRTYTDNDGLTYANRYTVRAWSQDETRNENSYDDAALYDRFIQVVNSQSSYNKDATIRAIPIIVYHNVGDQGTDYNTDLDLFNKEMKYLHNGNFTVLTMADLAYNDKSNYLYIKEFKPEQPETMAVVKSTPNFTEVPLKPVSTTEVPLKPVSTRSNVTESMANFTEVPLKPVSTRSNVTESMANFTEIPLKPVSTRSNVTESMANFTEIPLKPVSTRSNVTESMANFTEIPLKPVSTRSNVTELMANPIMDAFKILFGQQ